MRMKMMVLWLVLGLVVLPARAGSLPRGDAAGEKVSAAKLEAFTEVLRDAVEHKQIGGASALVARNGKIVYFAAVGVADTDGARPVAEDTIFRIASMSKPITSVTAMTLVEEGKLDVNDPVSKYLPEFKQSVLMTDLKTGATRAAAREITIHDLLTQTSGITYRFMGKPGVGPLYVKANVQDGLSESPFSLAENCRKIAGMPLLNDPGAAWEYGLNTDVLGRVIEVASGQTLSEAFEKRVLGPLKMRDTFFVVPEAKRGRLAAVFMPDVQKGTIAKAGTDPVVSGPLVWTTTYSTKKSGYFSGGAGLCSTAGDYARFLQMMLNGGELDGARVLKKESVDEMVKNQIGDLRIGFGMHGDKFGYGFGIMSEKSDRKDGDPAPVGTFSWGSFYGSYFWGDPKNQVIAVLHTQTWPNGHLKLMEGFKKAVYEAVE
jgi:CubicO group peptidase (beta-lactamase class C family)